MAEKRTGMRAAFEICAKNADKPPLTFYEIKRTLASTGTTVETLRLTLLCRIFQLIWAESNSSEMLRSRLSTDGGTA